MPVTRTSAGIGRLRVEAGLAQQQVDEQVAGLGLAVVVGVGDRLVRGLDRGDLGLQGLDLGFERSPTFLADAPRGFRGLARLDRLLEAAANSCNCASVVRRHLRERVAAPRRGRRHRPAGFAPRA